MRRTRSRALLPLSNSNSFIKRSRTIDTPQTPNIESIDWSKWVSASSTRNYLIKDPLLDWLGYHGSSFALKNPQYASKIEKATKVRSASNFTEFIMAQGNEFENKVMEYLYKKHRGVIVDIGGNGSENSKSDEKMKDTIAAMNRGVPIIYSGVLRNPENQTYGVPDLIVRSDWLGEIVRVSPIDKNEEDISAPLLKDPFSEDFDNPSPPKYHYRIVDIKFTTLYLRADGTHILNSGSFPAYKGQLYIYNLALGKIQGLTPNCAYILGRKWIFKSKGEIFKSSSCIDRLGVINYITVDLEYVEKTKKAIEWIKDMRQNGSEWEINKIPLCRQELYPNMSNYHDYPWHGVKKQLALENKEITNLWMCGVKNREIAFSKDIFKWTDPSCTSFNIGVYGEKTSRVLDQILAINKDSKLFKVQPQIIKNNDCGWQKKQTLEMFVDFEYVNDVISDFSKMPMVDAKAIIFMIGVGYFEEITKEWIYREFTVNSLNSREECRICTEFSDYVRQEAEWFGCRNPLLIHWSNAENWQWDNVYNKYEGIERTWIPSKKNSQGQEETQPRWFDLLQVFKKEPIVIKGCLGFGLKEVAGVLAEHNLIQTKWDTNNSCVDGTGAILGAFKAAKEARDRCIDFKSIPLVREIAKYNEVDCKVVGEIMTYIREEHCECSDELILYEEGEDI